MLVGIGVDIISNDRFLSSLVNQTFIEKTYSTAEIAESKSRNNPDQYLISRFAGKEAVFKSLNCYGENIRLTEIEILTKENFQPVVKLNGEIKKLAKKLNITNFMISISYENDYTVAFVVSESRCIS